MNKYFELSGEARRKRAIENGCVGKTAYESKEESYQKGQVSYLCKNCGKWHRSGKVSKFIAGIVKKSLNWRR